MVMRQIIENKMVVNNGPFKKRKDDPSTKAQDHFKYIPSRSTTGTVGDRRQRSLRGLLLRQVGALVLLCSTAIAQSTTASLSVLAIDPSGSVIPGADVAITNLNTDQRVRLQASPRGLAQAANLEPGTYSVRVEADGFAPTEVEEVVLNVNDLSRIRVELKLASATEQITVVESVSEVQASPAVQNVVDRQFVENLPLNGRSFQQLIAINPGVVQAPTTPQAQGQFSVNGQRTNSNYFTVDGVSANFSSSSTRNVGQAAAGTLPGLSAQGGTNALVSVDAMQEFNIQTSTYAPEFGRSPGAQIAIATRSGTNSLHGTLFEYFRNDALDANDWFANRDRLERPPLRQNDFGGVVGGPIVKNAAFFFVSHESLRLRQPKFGTEATPLPALRELAVPHIRELINAYPLPNREQIDALTGRFATTFSDPSSLDASSFRIDLLPSDDVTLFGRYNYSPSNTDERGAGAFGSPFTLSLRNITDVNLQTLTLGSLQVLSPTLNNELRFNYSRNRSRSFVVPDDLGGAVVPDLDRLFPSFTNREESQFANIVFGGGAWVVGVNGDSRQEQFHLVDSLSWVSGRHQVKLGFDFRRLRPSLGFPLVTIGGGFFGWAGPVGMVNGIAPFIAADQRDPIGIRIDNWSWYAQDEWKLSPKATFTYGVRWDYNPSPVGRDNQDLYAFRNLDTPREAYLSEPGVDLYDASPSNFAPRVGIAYQLGDKSGLETVLRGGYGLFYDMGLGIIGDSVMLGAPYYRRTRQRGPFPTVVEGFAGLPFTTEPPFHRADTLDPNIKLPRTHQWNVTVEQSLGASRSLELAYVAAIGRKLTRTEQYALGGVESAILFLTVGRSDASSNYQSLQATFRQRLSKGLQGLASYTWGHSIDNASTDTLLEPTADDVRLDLNRGSSDFDIRHMLNGALTYDLPEPSFSGFGKQLLRGWSFDALLRVQTALPVDLFESRLLGAGTFNSRPDIAPGAPLELEGRQYPGGRIFNRAAFVSPEEPRQGTLGRNTLRGFGLQQLDFTVRRRFALTERAGLQFRFELFNAFNTPSFANPIGDLASPLFGQSIQMFGRGLGMGGSSGGLNPLYQVGGARSIQLALKLQF